MSRSEFASAICHFMCQRIQQTPDFTAKLNIIYLANDVLHHSSKRPTSTTNATKGEVFCDAMLPYLSCILYNTYHNQTPENQIKVSKLLAIWKTKQIYEESKIDELESDMKGESLKPPQVTQPVPVNTTTGNGGGAGNQWGQSNSPQSSRPQNPSGGYHAVPPPVALQPMGNQFQSGPPVQQQQQQGNRLMNNLDSFLSSSRNRSDGPGTTTGNTRPGSDRNSTRDREERRGEDRDRDRDRGDRGERGHRDRGSEHSHERDYNRRDRDREDDRGSRKRRRSSSPSRRNDRSRYR